MSKHCLFTLLFFLSFNPLLAQVRHPDPGEGACLDCHSDLNTASLVHSPVKENNCQSCHAYAARRQRFRLSSQGKELCIGCHPQQDSYKVLHTILEAGECQLCHDPHQSEHGRLLKAPSGELCSLCHSSLMEEKSFLHGPAAAGACVVCHDPHGSDLPRLLVAEGSSLCLQCHLTMENRLQAGRTVHPPVEADCAVCHDPHAADVKYQLKLEVKDLCVACHNLINDQMRLATDHEPATTGKRCLNCHDPHVTKHPKLLSSDVKTLCLSCHNQPVPSQDRTLTNMKKLLDDNPDHHGPIRENNCTACHQPHGSPNFRLLFAEYPSEFYTDFEESKYQLCFSCHDPAFIREPTTTRLTGFRQGSRNLHYVHVNRAQKGRTCRACHETHASVYPSHIRTSVPFGKWDMPLKYTRTETGGSCLPGCHQERQYSREAKDNINEPLK